MKGFCTQAGASVHIHKNTYQSGVPTMQQGTASPVDSEAGAYRMPAATAKRSQPRKADCVYRENQGFQELGNRLAHRGKAFDEWPGHARVFDHRLIVALFEF